MLGAVAIVISKVRIVAGIVELDQPWPDFLADKFRLTLEDATKLINRVAVKGGSVAAPAQTRKPRRI